MSAPKLDASMATASSLVEAGQPALKKRAVDIVEEGSSVQLAMLDKHKPQPGARYTTCFVTWSHTEKKTLRSPKTTSKKGFAEILAQCWDDIKYTSTGDVAMIVFEEAHKNGQAHFHAILKVEEKTARWHTLEAQLRKRRIFCDVSCSSNSRAADCMLRYLMCYTQEKSEQMHYAP